MRHIAVFLLRCYKKFISPLLPPSCRFYPTCSEYAITAVGRYGVFRGGFLAVKRILRCQPFAKGGFDPVPDLPPSLAERIVMKIRGKATRL